MYLNLLTDTCDLTKTKCIYEYAAFQNCILVNLFYFEGSTPHVPVFVCLSSAGFTLFGGTSAHTPHTLACVGCRPVEGCRDGTAAPGQKQSLHAGWTEATTAATRGKLTG